MNLRREFAPVTSCLSLLQSLVFMDSKFTRELFTCGVVTIALILIYSALLRLRGASLLAEPVSSLRRARLLSGQERGASQHT